jgi:Flp pilus assembly protein TadG
MGGGLSLLAGGAVARLRRLPDHLRRDERGNVSMIFAAMLVPVCAIIGMSVDLGHSLQVRTQVQAALDAAVLAGGRTYQITGSVSEAEEAARSHFQAALPPGVRAEAVNAVVDEASYSIELSGLASVDTTFLRILGKNAIPVSALSRASLAVGGSDKDLEVALMLDITGSMCSPCSKITDLKAAARDLIQIVVPDVQTEHQARVAIVPFSASVNPGSYRTAVRGPNTSNTSSCPSGNSTSGWHKYQCYKDTRNRDQQVGRTNCVSERTGEHAFTDAAPSGPSTRVNAVYGGTCPTSSVVPLTTSKDSLNAAIDGLQTGGWTAGQIGTAWAWYTLSPEWSGIWPSASQPAAYGSDEVYKIAVLMTDGLYNTEHSNFVRSGDQYGNPNSPNGRSNEQALALCTAMKAKGITVYTVGFMLDDETATETLSDCATSSAHAFVAEDGAELKETFREIAFQLSQLRLSK